MSVNDANATGSRAGNRLDAGTESPLQQATSIVFDGQAYDYHYSVADTHLTIYCCKAIACIPVDPTRDHESCAKASIVNAIRCGDFPRPESCQH